MAPAVPLIEGEKLFRIGVNADCPVHQIFAGGQCFARYSEKVSGYGSETQRDKMKGSVVRMAVGGLDACLLSAKFKVIRSTKGRKSRARIYDTRSRNYRKMADDKPVLDYMYAIELETLANPYAGAAYPTLSTTHGEKTREIVEAHDKAEKEAAGWPKLDASGAKNHVDPNPKVPAGAPADFSKEKQASAPRSRRRGKKDSSTS